MHRWLHGPLAAMTLSLASDNASNMDAVDLLAPEDAALLHLWFQGCAVDVAFELRAWSLAAAVNLNGDDQ